MARIKHIAIRTPDPEKTAAFYKEVFGLQEVGQAGAGVYLSDGYINLAILKSSEQGGGESPRDVPGYAGIDHLGFQVDDVDDTWALVGRSDGFTIPVANPRNRIDYIWISKNKSLLPLKAWVPQSDASDHLPVVAEFELR